MAFPPWSPRSRMLSETTSRRRNTRNSWVSRTRSRLCLPLLSTPSRWLTCQRRPRSPHPHPTPPSSRRPTHPRTLPAQPTQPLPRTGEVTSRTEMGITPSFRGTMKTIGLGSQNGGTGSSRSKTSIGSSGTCRDAPPRRMTSESARSSTPSGVSWTASTPTALWSPMRCWTASWPSGTTAFQAAMRSANYSTSAALFKDSKSSFTEWTRSTN